MLHAMRVFKHRACQVILELGSPNHQPHGDCKRPANRDGHHSSTANDLDPLASLAMLDEDREGGDPDQVDLMDCRCPRATKPQTAMPQSIAKCCRCCLEWCLTWEFDVVTIP